jgi:hypothetical protein
MMGDTMGSGKVNPRFVPAVRRTQLTWLLTDIHGVDRDRDPRANSKATILRPSGTTAV